jgi:ribokinase
VARARSEDGRPLVLVVGSVNMDLVVQIPTLPTAGETVTGGVFEQGGGGKGANQAVAAARAGARVVFVGAVGDDDLGGEALELLEREDMDLSGVQRLPDAHTGVALIMVDQAGENIIAVASGANAALTGAMVRDALEHSNLDAGGVCLVNLEIADEPILEAVRLAAGAGLRVIVNPAPARALSEELLGFGPILTPNRTEAAALTSLEDPSEAAVQLAAWTRAPAVITLGGDGAVYAHDSEVEQLPAKPVKVVDTTGAGDVFNGVLAAELARGAELRAALDEAMTAAALATTGVGARTSQPWRDPSDKH